MVTDVLGVGAPATPPGRAPVGPGGVVETPEPGALLVDRQRRALAVDALWRYEALVARVAAGPAHLHPLLDHFGPAPAPRVARTADELVLGARLAQAVAELVDVLAVVAPGPLPEAPPDPATRRRWRARWLREIAALDGAVAATGTVPATAGGAVPATAGGAGAVPG